MDDPSLYWVYWAIAATAVVAALIAWGYFRNRPYSEEESRALGRDLPSTETLVVGPTAARVPNMDRGNEPQGGGRPMVLFLTDKALHGMGSRGGGESYSYPLVDMSSIGLTGRKLVGFSMRSGERVFVRVSDGAGFSASLRQAVGRAQSAHGAGAGPSVADELTKLAGLRDAGVLSSDDWEQAKTMYLGKPLSERDEAISQLRKLYDLHRAGVLSESEFNIKKWEILAKTP